MSRSTKEAPSRPYPALTGLPIYFRYIPANQLQADQAAYQRNVKAPLVRRIVCTFNPRALGALRIGERADGSLWIEDGLQRWTAVMQIDPTYELACMVYADSEAKQEAENFWIVNHNRMTLRPSELFKARLTAGDTATHNIIATVQQLGLIVKYQPGPLKELEIECVQLLDQLYADHELTAVLSIAIDAWGRRTTRAFTRSVLAGIRDFHRHYQEPEGRRYQREFLVSGLRATSPDALTQLAYQLGLVSSTTYRTGRAILNQYNSAAPSRQRLESWESRTKDRREWAIDNVGATQVIRFRGNQTPRIHEPVDGQAQLSTVS